MLVNDVAQEMALLPLAWLTVRELRSPIAFDDGWWWLAVAFAVSWVADEIAWYLSPTATLFPSLLYPIVQGGIIAAVLLPKASARQFTAVLVFCGFLSIGITGNSSPDILLHTVSSLGIAALAYWRPALGRLRVALLVYFGLGALAWWVHMATLSIPTWYVNQGVRLVGLLLLCWAASRPVVGLRLVRLTPTEA